MEARQIRVRGVVQGVGFRPFVYRLAQRLGLKGWVLNDAVGVEVWLEGQASLLEQFSQAFSLELPPAARIEHLESTVLEPRGYTDFQILESKHSGNLTAHISPDLAVCPDCLAELLEPHNRRYHYPYINCTNCGPRFSIITGLPYDRPLTAMQPWAMCADCEREYHDPLERRFHAQPTACPVCGPQFRLVTDGRDTTTGHAAIEQTAALLHQGKIVAVKGIGGYHLACDARNPAAVQALRERKFRKEKPFALMVNSLETAHHIAHLGPSAEALLTSVARPIVLAPARQPSQWEQVSPDNPDLGLMLPYTPLHHLLFAAGAPPILVLTSANRSSEPIAYQDEEALEGLAGIADAFLVGERPIVRRVEDSVARTSVFGAQILRRARGYAPRSVAHLPTHQPILALGADLKSSFTLVVEGQALVSQHLGDLEHLPALEAFQQTVDDLLRMYQLEVGDLAVVHDQHPEYHSTRYALGLGAKTHHAVQHHQAHVASVLAEHGLWGERVLGIAWDGTGYGEDGAIWGGEAFVGSLETGFVRVAQLEYAPLAGGDAAAQHPVQAAAGFLLGFGLDFSATPFHFPPRLAQAQQLIAKNLRTWPTSSMGRLFDCAAALLGFTRPQSFEGQAAIWLEHQARSARPVEPYPFELKQGKWQHRPLLETLIAQRLAGQPVGEVARGFIAGLALGLVQSCQQLCGERGLKTVVVSGGVFQNGLLLEEVQRYSQDTPLNFLVNHQVPPNDGGISLGQAALAAWLAVAY